MRGMSFFYNLNVCSKAIIFLSVLPFFAGCSKAQKKTPEINTRSTIVAGNQHRVEQGETLYSIARLYNQDFRELARNNNVYPPYEIYPGQELIVRQGSYPRTVPGNGSNGSAGSRNTGRMVCEPNTRNTQAADEHIVQRGESLYSIARRYRMNFRELARINNIFAPYSIFPGQRLKVQKYWTTRAISQSDQGGGSCSQINQAIKKESVKNTKAAAIHSSSLAWKWPVSGRTIIPFSLMGRVNKGIDIYGELGEPVRAAAGGRVIYTGEGLGRHGKLVIIKHNNSYLSAYSYNRDLFVSEGDLVKASQKIAEIGSTGTMEPRLHFEIRRNGKPVNPMGYLPKR